MCLCILLHAESRLYAHGKMLLIRVKHVVIYKVQDFSSFLYRFSVNMHTLSMNMQSLSMHMQTLSLQMHVLSMQRRSKLTALIQRLNYPWPNHLVHA